MDVGWTEAVGSWKILGLPLREVCVSDDPERPRHVPVARVPVEAEPGMCQTSNRNVLT